MTVVTLRSRLLLLSALCVGVCLVGIELMITAVALPSIITDLADWTEQDVLRRASWVVNGYLLAYIATMPVAGRAADRFGLAAPFGVALVVFALGSLLSGAAQTLEQLIAARVLQGVGGGALVPLATAGASHLFGGAARARALGVVGALTFLGMAIGPFAGAAILDVVDLSQALAAAPAADPLRSLLAPSWRWIFYLGVPFALLPLLYAWAAAPAWPATRRSGGLDLPGALVFTLALGALLLALTTLGDEAAPLVGLGPAALVVVAAVALAASLVRFSLTPEPFLPLRHFRDRTFSAAVLLSLLTGYALATAIIGGAVFVDRVHYGGPDEQQLALGALAAAMAVGALASGLAIRRLGVVAPSLLGLIGAAAGLAVLARSDPSTPLAVVAAALAVFGVGFGLTVTPRSAAAVEALGREAFGFASAAVTVARMIGMAVGLAVLTAIGSNRIEALSVVRVDAAARDAVLPPELRGRPLQDGLVVDALERWAAQEAAIILSVLFVIAAAVVCAAIAPALLMARRPAGVGRTERAEAGRVDEERLAVGL